MYRGRIVPCRNQDSGSEFCKKVFFQAKGYKSFVVTPLSYKGETLARSICGSPIFNIFGVLLVDESCSMIYYRPLEEHDFMAFVELRKEAFLKEPESFGSDYTTYTATPLIDKEHFFEKVLNYPFSFVLGAFAEDNTMIGIAGFTCHTATKRRHKGILWGMYVKPAFRLQGIARKLAEIIMLSAKEDAQCEQILITVSPPGSVAHQFYDRLGFIQYGVEYRALKLDDEYVDEVLMMRVL